MLHQLLLAQVPVHELFREVDAREVEQLDLRLEPAIDRHRDRPRAREHFRVLDRRLVAQRIRRDRREALDDVQGIAVEIPRAVEPRLVVEMRHVDHERVSVPAPDRVAHPRVVRRTGDGIQVNRAGRVRERVHHLDLVRALHDLKRIRHVGRARDARQIAFELRIAVDPVCRVLRLPRRGRRRVRNLPVALHHADRSRNDRGRAEREHGSRGDLGVGIWIDAALCHGAGARVVRLQVPVRLVVGLPHAADVRLAVRGACRARALAGEPRHRDADGGGHDGCRQDGCDERASGH